MKFLFAVLSTLVMALSAAADAPPARGDWRAEKDLRKRVELGLTAAEAQLDEARKIYREGDPYKSQEQLELSVDSMMEAFQMVVDEGEDMRKRAGRYKKFEIQLRGIFRKLEDFERQADLVDRGPIVRARETVSRMQDALLKSMFQGGTLPPVEKVKP